LKINNLNFKSMSVLFSYCLTIKQNLKWSLKYVTDKNNDSDRSHVLKRRLSCAFGGKKRSRHVYKMHRHAVEHDDGRLFITRKLRRRSLSYSRWYIDVYLHYVWHVVKMLLHASVERFNENSGCHRVVRVCSRSASIVD